MKNEQKNYVTLKNGENLLDRESHKKLPPLDSGEEQGLDAFAQVKLVWIVLDKYQNDFYVWF